VLVVLGPLEAEMAGELVAEGAVLGSQAGVLGAGGAPPAPRIRPPVIGSPTRSGDPIPDRATKSPAIHLAEGAPR